MPQIRHKLAIYKLPQCISFVKEILKNYDEKLIIFFYHRDIADSLINTLEEYNPLLIIGGMNTVKKQEAIDKFINESKHKILCSQITAGGQGIDGLQTVCNHVIFVEISWVPGEIDQAIDRLNRIGQTNPVLCQIFYVPDTLEAKMIHTVRHKRRVIDKLINTQERKQTMHLEELITNVIDETRKSNETLLEINNNIITLLDFLKNNSNCECEKKDDLAKEAQKPKRNAKAKEKTEVPTPTTSTFPTLSKPEVITPPTIPTPPAPTPVKVEAEVVYTLNDVMNKARAYISRYKNTYPDQPNNTALASTELRKILAPLGLNDFNTIPKEHFAGIIEKIDELMGGLL
jgi:Helicase conserved C-terminal domain